MTSPFAAGYDTTITVAPQTGEGSGSDPSYGTRVEVDCKRETVTKGEELGGSIVKVDGDALITAQREFEKTDAVWLPGADTTDPKESVSLRQVGGDSMAGLSLYWGVI